FSFVLFSGIVMSLYGVLQAEFLFGTKVVWVVKVVYVASIFVGAIGGAKVIWSFLDTSLAGMAIPNIIALLLLRNVVVNLKRVFFTSPDYYLADISRKK